MSATWASGCELLRREGPGPSGHGSDDGKFGASGLGLRGLGLVA